MQTSSREENTEFNRSEFCARLLALEPASVLDVGCGSGDLLSRLTRANVEATGVEPGSPEPLAPDLKILEADAEKLPFDDASFDWVAMRFVPHHLRSPARAFAEAIRVARSGFFVAEPWFDTSLASQRAALALDVWVKRQDRRGGMVHEEVLTSRELLAVLPDSNAFDIEIATSMRLRAWPQEHLASELAPHREKLGPQHEDLESLAQLETQIARDGITWNGSLFVVARKRG